MTSLALDLGALRYDDAGLVTCVCQDATTGAVLMVAWATREALELTLTTGHATFWSRSRGELWEKGATSGNTLDVVELVADCDGDTVLALCNPRGPACHTGAETCFGPGRALLDTLARTIRERAGSDPRESFVARQLGGPREHVARKVGEEVVEVLLAPAGSDDLVGEVADLWFHSMLLLARDGLDPLAPLAVLARRHEAASGPT
ncbi:MAG: phosphoribosyl-AMP cyclohydrolase / phosphoribosyl-ATP pyrophosphohydrolase [Gaiellales bacterium]|jgi:phosphoribosyl-ATP pyrophosphohydrolase/phosphoribosyl-AMP cyclohydrolase|nr:phosphoribosyl-AMP cyclohydrolase / phosphoribosyl-ATP pyrophosphohydrolase [Gaiellales bacterium]